MLEFINPFALKDKFDILNTVRQEFGDPAQDWRFLRALRRALLPVPWDRRVKPDTNLFPPLRVTPHPVLAGKRIGLVTSGGSGALVALCGVKRALEEAGIEIEAISVCSGSAIWGSMIASGFTAQQMVETTLKWTPADLVDPDWKALATVGPKLGRGFTGVIRGERLERTMDTVLGARTLVNTPIPYYAIVYNLDTNRVEYFGPHNHPGVTLARMVRVAISLPLFVQPVRFDDHLYVDGGVINIFPVEPLLALEKPFDYIIGVNVIMPEGFAGEDITGWETRPLSVINASRQLYHGQWLELARQQVHKVRDRLLLLEPLSYSEIKGSKFFEVFFDSSKWPHFIRKSYEYTRARLAAFDGTTGAA